jgi:hypothetical protein
LAETRIAILADKQGALALAAPGVLAPVGRIFDPVLIDRVVCLTRFSDFPSIILAGIRDDEMPENRWRDMIVDLQIQLLSDQIVLRYDLPVVMFSHRRIEGSVGMLPPGFMLSMEPGTWPS